MSIQLIYRWYVVNMTIPQLFLLSKSEFSLQVRSYVNSSQSWMGITLIHCSKISTSVITHIRTPKHHALSHMTLGLGLKLLCKFSIKILDSNYFFSKNEIILTKRFMHYINFFFAYAFTIPLVISSVWKKIMLKVWKRYTKSSNIIHRDYDPLSSSLCMSI